MRRELKEMSAYDRLAEVCQRIIDRIMAEDEREGKGKPIDQDELQAMDENDEEWVKAWMKAVKR